MNEVITQHREFASFRISTDDDLEPLRASVPDDGAAQVLKDWTLVTFNWRRPSDPPQRVVFAVGVHVQKRRGWNTSPVLLYDERTACIRTRSGSLYQLLGPASDKPDPLRLCAWLHSCGVGPYTGALDIFY